MDLRCTKENYFSGFDDVLQIESALERMFNEKYDPSDLVSSNVFQTLDVACYSHQSYVGVDRLQTLEDRI